jgi:hypothetical protein
VAGVSPRHDATSDQTACTPAATIPAHKRIMLNMPRMAIGEVVARTFHRLKMPLKRRYIEVVTGPAGAVRGCPGVA